MTSIVTVSACSGHDVAVVQQDRHPADGWVDSQRSTVAEGTSQTFYVWSDRRILVEEVMAMAPAQEKVDA